MILTIFLARLATAKRRPWHVSIGYTRYLYFKLSQ
jgi:hypothetical protein